MGIVLGWHCVQYAAVGNEPIYVYGTEDLSDAEVRREAVKMMETVGDDAEVVRYNRCPECEVWTTDGGKLRRGIGFTTHISNFKTDI